MWEASSGSRLLMRATFHSFDSLESFHRDVASPFPTAFPRCFIRRSRSKRTPLQPWEIADVAFVFRKEDLWQYFPKSTLARRLSGVILSQETQQILRAPFEESHQKRVNTDCIFLQRLAGSSKQVIAKDGIGERTDMIMVAFPAVERNLVDQLRDFCFILSIMESKRSFFLRPKCSGVLLEKEIEDLRVFIFCPDAASYFLRMSTRVVQAWVSVLVKNMVSSANKRVPTRLPHRWWRCRETTDLLDGFHAEDLHFLSPHCQWGRSKTLSSHTPSPSVPSHGAVFDSPWRLKEVKHFMRDEDVVRDCSTRSNNLPVGLEETCWKAVRPRRLIWVNRKGSIFNFQGCEYHSQPVVCVRGDRWCKSRVHNFYSWGSGGCENVREVCWDCMYNFFIFKNRESQSSLLRCLQKSSSSLYALRSFWLMREIRLSSEVDAKWHVYICRF